MLFLAVRNLAAKSAVLFLCLSSGITGTFTLAQSRSSDAYTEAASAFQQGKLDQAEQELRTAISSEPDRPDLLGLLGLVLDAKKQYPEAEPFHEHEIGRAHV